MSHNTSISKKLDLVAQSATELQGLLSAGALTSARLVEECLAQIDRHDQQGMNLRAMIAVTPKSKLLEMARELDVERESNRLRGPFHGIPIIVKDIFNTDPGLGMATTLGSFALQDAKHSKQAFLVQRLVERGLIILGKANLSEFGAAKGEKAVGGLSALGGQCQSPYIKGGVVRGDSALGQSNPGGSSTGSAVGVAAGYSPLAIGGEADGSINTPASRASLFALKCTPQTIPSDGVFLIAPTFESPGGFAKTVGDLAGLIEIIVSTTETLLQLPKELPTTWFNLTLGFVDQNIWQLPSFLLAPDEEYSKQMTSSYEAAINKIKSLGGHVHYPIPLVHPSTLQFQGSSGYLTILLGEIRESVNRTLEALPSTPVRSLADIIKFNDEHPDLQAGLEQTYHIQAQEDSTSQETLAEARLEMKRRAGEEGIDKMMSEFGLDVIIAPMDSPISTVAALAGYPSATMPLGYHSQSGLPFGFCLVAKAHQERKLLEVMHVYEATFPKRRLPHLLYEAESKI